MSGLGVQARDLIKIYRTQRIRYRALRGVSCEIAPGEFVAVTGASGSGKSTLLHLLAGIEPPTAGEIYVGGQLLHRMNEDQLAAFRQHHTGFIFQNFNLFADLTIAENAAFPLMVAGAGKSSRDRKAAALLQRLGLGAHLDHLPGELSGGQQQRAAIARALVNEPGLVFADEPTGNLDSVTAGEVMNLLEQEVRGRGMTLIMVTHDAVRAERADRIIQLSDGQIESVRAGLGRKLR